MLSAFLAKFPLVYFFNSSLVSFLGPPSCLVLRCSLLSSCGVKCFSLARPCLKVAPTIACFVNRLLLPFSITYSPIIFTKALLLELSPVYRVMDAYEMFVTLEVVEALEAGRVVSLGCFLSIRLDCYYCYCYG